jgi:hypothetical protein
MATAAIIGGGLVLGGIAGAVGSGIQANANVDAANIQAESAANALASSEAFQQQQQQTANQFIPGAVTAQQAQLGLLGQEGGDPNAAQNLLDSPLVQAINAQNQQNVAAQMPGQGGGNLLSALQNANTATILNAGFNGLGSITQQGGNLGLGFTAQAGQGLGMANQAQFAQGNALGNAASAQGTANAIPFLAGANAINQGTQLGAFALGGGVETPAQAPAGAASGSLAPAAQFNSFNVAPPLL